MRNEYIEREFSTAVEEIIEVRRFLKKNLREIFIRLAPFRTDSF